MESGNKVQAKVNEFEKLKCKLKKTAIDKILEDDESNLDIEALDDEIMDNVLKLDDRTKKTHRSLA